MWWSHSAILIPSFPQRQATLAHFSFALLDHQARPPGAAHVSLAHRSGSSDGAPLSSDQVDTSFLTGYSENEQNRLPGMKSTYQGLCSGLRHTSMYKHSAAQRLFCQQQAAQSLPLAVLLCCLGVTLCQITYSIHPSNSHSHPDCQFFRNPQVQGPEVALKNKGHSLKNQ